MKYFCVGLVLLGASLGITPTAGAQDESVCPDPQQAAIAWTAHFPENFGGDPAACPQLCKKWEQSCEGIVKTAVKCDNGELTQTIKLVKASCETLTEPEEALRCLDAVQGVKDILAATIETLEATGNLICRQVEPTCVEQCQTPAG